ncbi:MAG: S41 family peptidase [Muribaculaceae bacterium]|nr:S41 family peptidase [Muribaculaceae bacterium]
MKPKSTRQPIWLPIAISLAVVVGLFIGNRISPNNYAADNDRKVNAILNLINQDYVDSTNINDLIEMSIPEILSNLDPHTTYMSAEELRASAENASGSISDIGIQFEMTKDTAMVIEVIPGSPSSKAAIMPGDLILSINDEDVTGGKASKGAIAKQLRGPKGSQVKLGIKRRNTAKTMTFNVTRGDIPVNTVDAHYMIDKNTGYLKINQFGRNTFKEFLRAMKSLESEGASRYIIDLRGNGGGFMEVALRMANEFLPAGKPIVYTKGRYKRDSNEAWSEGNGSFQDAELAVLIDEFSASASEIFAGAMQDNDRGLIVGCRSYGKGLVQKEFILPDSSAIRLTTARYYTPSGRCIQKLFKRGENEEYDNELMERYLRGEMINPDSIKFDKSQMFKTAHGRTVYGGGGIIPDIFVPLDNGGLNNYYNEVESAGLLHQFAFNLCNDNRQGLSKMSDYKQFLRMAPSDESILKDFADFASANGIAPRWYYINQSHDMIVTKIKALIAREIFGSQAYYPILNRNDKTVQTALKALNKHKAVFPITETLNLKSIAQQRNRIDNSHQSFTKQHASSQL